MAARATSTDADGSASIGQLVASIKDDLTGLLRAEIELAKAELKEDAKAAAIGLALAVLAGLLLVLAVILGSFALVYGVAALGLTRGWAFVVVTGFYVVLAAVLLLVAKGRFGKVTGVGRAKVTAREAARAIRPSQRT